MTDALTLKWGTLKAWHFESEPARAAAKRYDEAHNGVHSLSAMAQRETPETIEALCGIIDAVDCETIYHDWDGTEMSKEEAKAYVRNYRR